MASEQSCGCNVYVGNLAWSVNKDELKEHMEATGKVLDSKIFMDPFKNVSKGCGLVTYSTEEEAKNAIEKLTNTPLRDRLIFVREDRESTFDGANREGGENKQPFPSRGRPGGGFYSGRGDRGRGRGGRGRGYYGGGGYGGGGYNGGYNGGGYHDGGYNGGGYRGGYGGRGGGRYGSGYYNGGGYREGDEGRQIFVSNLAWGTSWKDLKNLFSEAGPIIKADVKLGSKGQSKGYGIVLFQTQEAAQHAINSFDGLEFQGRPISVRHDKKL